MYLTDLTESEWQYLTKVLNLQTRKRKYDLEYHILFSKNGLPVAYASQRVPQMGISLLLLPEMGFSRRFRFAS